MWVQILIECCNVTTIASSFILKVPQVIKLLQTGNTYGISLNGLLVEYLAHCIVFSYNWFQNYPILSYLEYALLLIQDIVLILIILNSRNILDVTKLGILGFSIAFFCSIANGYPNSWILPILINFVIPTGASSKILYIRELWRAKDSSNVSLTTWVIASYTSMARMITNGMKGDIPLFLHSSTSATLCTVMSILTVYFAKSLSKPVIKNDSTNEKRSMSTHEDKKIK